MYVFYKSLNTVSLLCCERKSDYSKIIYSDSPRGSAKESFIGNEAAHNQGLLAASTDIIIPPWQHNHMEKMYFLLNISRLMTL